MNVLIEWYIKKNTNSTSFSTFQKFSDSHVHKKCPHITSDTFSVFLHEQQLQVHAMAMPDSETQNSNIIINVVECSFTQNKKTLIDHL